jgi:broad specificity phosphatase PhoE
MTVNLYLARHGQTQWNKVQRYQGRLDSELTLLGEQQSAEIALQLTNKNIDLIVSSPLGRAAAGAKICQQQLMIPVIYDDGLIERDLGDWQGLHITDISNDESYHEIFHQITQLSPAGGESALTCGERVYQTLKLLAKRYKNKNLLIICHGEALRCLLAQLGNNSTDNAYQLFNNGCLLKLTYEHHNNNFQITT